MSQVLPPLFIVVAGIALLSALFAFWQSLRWLLLARPDPGDVALGTDARLRLVDEKATLLKSIKELEFERDVGKISEHDYEALNARYRSRAKHVLRALDTQLGAHRSEAAALVAQVSPAAGAEQVADGGQPASASGPTAVSAGSVEPSAKQGSTAATEGPLSCPACNASNDSDAAFCKKCGQAMAEEPA